MVGRGSPSWSPFRFSNSCLFFRSFDFLCLVPLALCNTVLVCWPQRRSRTQFLALPLLFFHERVEPCLPTLVPASQNLSNLFYFWSFVKICRVKYREPHSVFIRKCKLRKELACSASVRSGTGPRLERIQNCTLPNTPHHCQGYRLDRETLSRQSLRL